jgi:ankyrin repeat protein
MPDGKYPLHEAAQNGNIRDVMACLAAGVCIDSRNKRHNTPLMQAAENGHVCIVQALLAAGEAEAIARADWIPCTARYRSRFLDACWQRPSPCSPT